MEDRSVGVKQMLPDLVRLIRNQEMCIVHSPYSAERKTGFGSTNKMQASDAITSCTKALLAYSEQLESNNGSHIIQSIEDRDAVEKMSFETHL